MRFLNLIFLFLVTGISAQIQMSPLFSDDMILQRESQVSLWGSATPNENVTVQSSWNNKTTNTKADNQGNWIVNIETPLAGGPHEINILSGDSVLNYSNVLIGEVWIASGQSNMQMALFGGGKEPIIGSIDMIAQSKNTNIRLFTVKRSSSETPTKELRGQWLVSSPANSSSFSAVAYSFANYLNKVLDIPIGIINTSWGGSPAEAWTDNKTLVDNFSKTEIRNNHKDKAVHHNPSGLFNAMINPFF